MKFIVRICLFVFFLLTFTFGQRVLLISMDGFRYDYIKNSHLNNLTAFHRMIADGGWAVKGLKNVFLTKTFPNHYTLATGLYEESHGVVGNVMYDPKFNATYNVWDKNDVEDPRWYSGEPIWVTNQRQDTTHRSGVIMWPTSVAPIKGFLPYRVLPYNANMSFNDRVDTIVDWFLDEEFPINLGILYIEEPDETGHKYGPNSTQIATKLVELNDVLQRLLYKLEDNKILGSTDIILTSDHGMASIPDDDSYKIDLNKYIRFDSYFVTSTNPVAAIFPHSDELEKEIYKNLSGIPHVHVYRKHDIPSQYHYTHHRRIAPIILEPEEHYWVSYNNTVRIAGQHGYNNSLDSMHPIFIAMGPSFKKGATVEIFNNVDVYPLLCTLLGLKPAPNNGSMGVVRNLLVEKFVNEDYASPFGMYIFIVLIGATFAGVYSLAACQVHRHSRRHQVKLRSFNGLSTTPDYGYSQVDSTTKPLMSETSEDEFV